MIRFEVQLRTATAWLLISALSGVIPAGAAQQPGTVATPAVSLPLFDAVHLAPLPQAAQPQNPATTGAAPAPAASHHISKWVWVALVAGAGVAVGAALIAGNAQAGKTAAVSPTVTVAPGSGVTAGAP
jgi:hypothetical protein